MTLYCALITIALGLPWMCAEWRRIEG